MYLFQGGPLGGAPLHIYFYIHTSASDGLCGGMTAVPGRGWSKIPSRFPASGFMKSTGVRLSLPFSRGDILGIGCATDLFGIPRRLLTSAIA